MRMPSLLFARKNASIYLEWKRSLGGNTNDGKITLLEKQHLIHALKQNNNNRFSKTIS